MKTPSCFARRRAQTKAFFVGDLQDVVEDFEIHRRGENIFADSFDDVGFRFADIAGLEKFVIERADGIDADDFDGGIFLLEETADAADGASRAHAANEMRDFAFGVFPDFRAGGAVMGFGVHGIFVLIGVKGIGNFAREFFRYGIVAARIVRLNSGGADDDFGAESFEEIDFFARLLVRDGENDFIAAHGGDESEAHSRVAGSAFDNGAAGFEEAFALGFVDHPGGDTIFYGAAGIHVIGFDVDFGFDILRDAIEPDERRFADGFEDVFATHVCSGLSFRRANGSLRTLANEVQTVERGGLQAAVTMEKDKNSARKWVVYSYKDSEDSCSSRTTRQSFIARKIAPGSPMCRRSRAVTR